MLNEKKTALVAMKLVLDLLLVPLPPCFDYMWCLTIGTSDRGVCQNRWSGVSTFLSSLPFLPPFPLPSSSLSSPTSFLPVPSCLLPLCFSLRSRVPLNQLEGLGSAVSPHSGSRAEAWLKMNLVHARAVRMTLVAIILSILKCMFYSRLIKI